MKSDILLSYMSHLGEGRWQKLRYHFLDVAVDSGCEPERESRLLRYALEEIAFADFFLNRTGSIAASDVWRVHGPSLARIGYGTSALVCGARDPYLRRRLDSAGKRHECIVDDYMICVSQSMHFTVPRVFGSLSRLHSIAVDLEIPFIANAPDAWLSATMPLSQQLRHAVETQRMSGWELQEYDLSAQRAKPVSNWDDCTYEVGAVIEQSRQWLPSRRSVLFDGRWVDIGYREALYAGAMLRGLSILAYDSARCRLRVPIVFPLPLSFARAAVMCSGSLPSIEGANRVYCSVPHRIASVMGMLLGQWDLAHVSSSPREKGTVAP